MQDGRVCLGEASAIFYRVISGKSLFNPKLNLTMEKRHCLLMGSEIISALENFSETSAGSFGSPNVTSTAFSLYHLVLIYG